MTADLDNAIRATATLYGFQYGAATVERAMHNARAGWVDIDITTPRARLQVYVTKTGKVRVFDMKNGGAELKAVPDPEPKDAKR